MRAIIDLWGFTKEIEVNPEALYIQFPAIGMKLFSGIEFKAQDFISETEPRLYKFHRFMGTTP